MANSDTAHTAYAITALFQEQFMSRAVDQWFRHGRITERIFKPSDQLFTAKDNYLPVISGTSDSVRGSRHILESFGDQRPFRGGRLNLRLNPEDPTVNDFHSFNAVAEVSDSDMIRAGNDPSYMTDVVGTLVRHINQRFQDSTAQLLHLPASGRTALMNGTKKKADATTYAGASSYTNGATEAIIKIDSGSIAAFEPGTRWDFYSAAGALLADEVEITMKNPAELSLRLKLTTSGPNQSTVANLDDLADNAEIYRSAERNKGVRSSVGEWFSTPTAGESFIGGVDRTTSDYLWMVPVKTREDEASNATVRADFFDDLMDAMAYNFEGGAGMTFAMMGNQTTIQSLRKSIGDEAISQQPSRHDGAYNFGQLALYYQHPAIGQMALIGDPLAPRDALRFLRLEDWMKCYGGFRGVRMFDGGEGHGIWFRKDGELANGGKSKYWRCEGYQTCAWFCRNPRAQGAIMKVQP